MLLLHFAKRYDEYPQKDTLILKREFINPGVSLETKFSICSEDAEMMVEEAEKGEEMDGKSWLFISKVLIVRYIRIQSFFKSLLSDILAGEYDGVAFSAKVKEIILKIPELDRQTWIDSLYSFDKNGAIKLSSVLSQIVKYLGISKKQNIQKGNVYHITNSFTVEELCATLQVKKQTASDVTKMPV